MQEAWDMVRAEGLAGLSLRDLATRVGMRAPSLYAYFESKNAIYDAMFGQAAEEFVAQESQVPRSGNARQDLIAGLRFFMSFCTSDPARYQLLFQRTIPGFEPSPDTFAVAVRGLEATRDRLAHIGITDPRALDLVTAVGTGLTDQQISNDPGGERWSQLIEDAADMFLDFQLKHL